MSTRLRSPRRGMTLLELLLSLGITILLVAAVAGAMQFQLFTLDASRARLEEAQLARAILRRLSDDIRGTVQEAPIDFSAVTKLAGNTLAGADPSQLDPSQLESLAGSEAAADIPDETLDNATSEAESFDMEQISTTTNPSAVPGLYGTENAIQIDVSRLPRIDEYQRMTVIDVNGLVRTQFPSDVKTVTYYLRPHDLLMAGASAEENADELARRIALDPQYQLSAGGLIRREVDRAVALWKMENIPADAQQQYEDLLATEVVAMQFRYFDGVEWLNQWDSTANEGLPLAIEIALVLDAKGIGEVVTADLFAPDATDEIFGTLDPTRSLSVYRQVVNLPLAKIPEEEEVPEEEMEEEPIESSASEPPGGGQ